MRHKSMIKSVATLFFVAVWYTGVCQADIYEKSFAECTQQDFGHHEPQFALQEGRRVLDAATSHDDQATKHWRNTEPQVHIIRSSEKVFLRWARGETVVFDRTSGHLLAVETTFPKGEAIHSLEQCLQWAADYVKALDDRFTVVLQAGAEDRRRGVVKIVGMVGQRGKKHLTGSAISLEISRVSGNLVRASFIKDLQPCVGEDRAKVDESAALSQFLKDFSTRYWWSRVRVNVEPAVYRSPARFGFTELSDWHRECLASNSLILTYRCTALDLETWDSSGGRVIHSIDGQVDAVTGRTIAMVETTVSNGGFAELRPSRDLDLATGPIQVLDCKSGCWSQAETHEKVVKTSETSMPKPAKVVLKVVDDTIIADYSREAGVLRTKGRAGLLYWQTSSELRALLDQCAFTSPKPFGNQD